MLKATVYNDPEHEFSRYSSDYELYSLGEYDDNTGKIESTPPAHICNLNQLKWEDPPKGAADPDVEPEIHAVQ